jgi:hypothetical protein
VLGELLSEISGMKCKKVVIFLPCIKVEVEIMLDRLCGLVVGASGYRYRGLGFDPRRYQIF